MSYAQTELFTILKNDSGVTSLLDTYSSAPAIFMDNQLPSDFTGDSSLLCYKIDVVDFSIDYGRYRYNIACRSNTYSKAVNLQIAVKEVLNRYSQSGLYIYVDGMPCIVPQDKTDNYNAPLSIVIKQR